MPSKVKISLIPNDLSQDLEKVFQLCSKENVKYVELASMWNKSILDLNQEEEHRVHELLEKYNLQVASVQTQIMKVFPPGSKLARSGSKNMHWDFQYNTHQIDRAIELAKNFNTPYIVMYSFFNKLVGITEENWQNLFKVYSSFLPKLESAQKVAVIECEPDTYIRTINNYLRFFKYFDSPYIRANLDLANLLGAQQEFNHDEFEQLFPYVPYFHVKDRKIRRFLPNKSAVLDTGSVPWKKILLWFNEKGFDGILSVEPHVHGKNKFELGRQCVRNLQKILTELNIEFD